MKYFSFLIFTTTILSSCSHYSKNLVTSGKVTFKEGVYSDQKWKGKLRFERTSWMQELTLLYDVLWSPIGENSPYFAWFSNDEKEIIKGCDQFFVALRYSLDAKRVSHSDVRNTIEQNGLNEIIVNSFSKNLKSHPSWLPYGLNQHKVSGFCQKGNLKDDQIVVTVPGYNKEYLSSN